jgi:hypothetical protein
MKSLRPARSLNFHGLATIAVIIGAIVVAFSMGGCAHTCSAPEAAFGRFVSNDLRDPSAHVVGMCEVSQTEDTGEDVVTCRVLTRDHGLIHKRLLARSCWY